MKFVVDIKTRGGDIVRTIEGTDINTAKAVAEKMVYPIGIVTGITEITAWVLSTVEPITDAGA